MNSASSASAQDEDYTKMFAAALAARENSYSPISGFKVRAAILTETGNIYAGTNVEDAGFNSTIHAEAGPEGDIRLKTTLNDLLPHSFSMANFR